MIRFGLIQFRFVIAYSALTGSPLMNLQPHCRCECPNVQMLFLAGKDAGVDARLAGHVIIHDQSFNLLFDFCWVKFRTEV